MSPAFWSNNSADTNATTVDPRDLVWYYEAAVASSKPEKRRMSREEKRERKEQWER